MRTSPAQSTEQLFTVDKDCGIPIWLQLRNRLIYLIASGYYETGDKIPTVRELAVALGINYNTVGKVYRDIERDGYIISLRGKGTFVHDGYRDSDTSDDPSTDVFVDDFIRQCLELGIVKEEIPRIVQYRIQQLDD